MPAKKGRAHDRWRPDRHHYQRRSCLRGTSTQNTWPTAVLGRGQTFFENDRRTPTGLDGWLRQRGFRRVFLAGLATDFCVAWSAEDAVHLGYEVVVVEDACRGIGVSLPGGRTSMDEARERLAQLGVRFVTGNDLAA